MTPLGLAALLLGAFAAPASAHERWVQHELLSPFDHSLFTTPGPVNLGLLLVALALLGLATGLARRTPDKHPSDSPPGPLRDAGLLLLGVTFGVGCVLSALSGEYLAPDLVGDGSLAAQVLIWGSAATGALLALGLFTRPAAWISLALFTLAVVERPFEPFDGSTVGVAAILNYFDVVGIAAFLGLAGRGRFSLERLWKPKPVPSQGRGSAAGVLRLALGLTLVILGTQKFLVPELPMGVVQNYGDVIFEPFHRLLGVSEELYVFGAALVEFTVGLLLITGSFTRVVMVVLAVLFTSTLFVFKGEVFGHLPLFGIVVLLLVEGGGRFRLAPLGGSPMGSGRGLGTAAAVLVTVFLTGCSRAQAGEATHVERSGLLHTGSVTGERGLFDFAITFRTPELGQLFKVETQVRDHKTGQLLPTGALHLDCTMPAHGHGMMTSPLTLPSESLPPGFTTSGMKLHMFGEWAFELSMDSGGAHDEARLSFDFEPTP